MAFAKIDYDAPSGAIQKYFDETLPVCPFCGGRHSYEIEMTETFTTLYRFRCTVCGAVLKMESMRQDPFSDPFLSLEVENSGKVNAANLLSLSAYSIKDLVYFADRIKNIAPPAEKPKQAPHKQEIGTITTETKKFTATLPKDFSLNDLIGADIQKGKRRTAHTGEHAALHEEQAGSCQNDHIYGEEENKSKKKKNKSGKGKAALGIVIFACFIFLFVLGILLSNIL